MSGHPVAVAAGRLVPPARYRHPGDVIRLIAAGTVLLVSLVASKAAHRWLLGPDAAAGGVGSGSAGPSSQCRAATETTSEQASTAVPAISRITSPG